jgi:hypothetical protein
MQPKFASWALVLAVRDLDQSTSYFRGVLRSGRRWLPTSRREPSGHDGDLPTGGRRKGPDFVIWAQIVDAGLMCSSAAPAAQEFRRGGAQR